MKLNQFFSRRCLFEEDEEDNSYCLPIGNEWICSRCSLIEKDENNVCCSLVENERICLRCWSFEEDGEVGSCYCSSVDYDVLN